MDGVRYEILGPLGAGGMGEVYRVRDTTLARDVALKVMPVPAADTVPATLKLVLDWPALLKKQEWRNLGWSTVLSDASLDELTTHDYNKVMNKVRIADLKAHLSQHLRQVRGGRTLMVLDRETPVAQIVPYEKNAPLEMIRATRKPGDLRLPVAPSAPTDSLSVLLEDRASR